MLDKDTTVLEAENLKMNIQFHFLDFRQVLFSEKQENPGPSLYGLYESFIGAIGYDS